MIQIWAESPKFNTTCQRLANQVRLIFEKGWFSDFKTLEIYESGKLWRIYSSKPHLNKLKHKYWKLEHHRSQCHHINVNTRWKKRWRVNENNCDWPEGYIAIPKESRLEKSEFRNWKCE